MIRTMAATVALGLALSVAVPTTTPDQIGQDLNSVHLKSERGWNTYGLRPGSVGVFNSRIVGSGRVDDW
jgi:hypothetical protein